MLDRPCVRLLGITMFLLVAALSGCTAPLTRLDAELDQAGLTMWYPPESGIQPGDIWHVSNDSRQVVCRRPPSLTAVSSALRLASSKTTREIAASTGSSLSNSAIEKLAGVRAELAYKSTGYAEVEFGESVMTRIEVGDLLRQLADDELPNEYSNSLRRVIAGERGWALVGAVATTKSLLYRVNEGSEFDAKAAAKTLSELSDTSVGFNRKSSLAYTLEGDGKADLCVGVSFVAPAVLTSAPGRASLANEGTLVFAADQHVDSMTRSLARMGAFDSIWLDFRIATGGLGESESLGLVARSGPRWFIIETVKNIDIRMENYLSDDRRELILSRAEQRVASLANWIIRQQMRGQSVHEVFVISLSSSLDQRYRASVVKTTRSGGYRQVYFLEEGDSFSDSLEFSRWITGR